MGEEGYIKSGQTVGVRQGRLIGYQESASPAKLASRESKVKSQSSQTSEEAWFEGIQSQQTGEV